MKKIALSLMVAGVVSSAFASEAANLANIAPTNHDKVAIALDTYYKGTDIWGASSFALGFDGKYGLVQAANGELYFRLAGHAGVRSKDVHRFLEIGGGLGWSQKLSENQFVELETNYKYGLVTGDVGSDLKNWREYGVQATYGYRVAEWLSVGVSGSYDKTQYDLYAIKNIKGSTYGFGVPISISISKGANLNIYGGYQSQRLDGSDLKKGQPIVTLGITAKF